MRKRAGLAPSGPRRSLEETLVPALRALSAASGLFCIVMAVLLVIFAAALQAADPLSSVELTEMKRQVSSGPAGQALAETIRARDLAQRSQYFTSRGRIDSGAILLAIGFTLFASSLRLAGYLSRRIPDPAAAPPPSFAAASRGARKAILILGAVAAAGVLLSAVLVRRDLRADARAVKNSLGLGGYPSRIEVEKNWPGFRGPLAGRAPAAAAADGLSASGPLFELWRAPLELPGRSSPAAWGGRLYVTGGTAEAQDVTALDAASGARVWRRTVKELLSRAAPMPDVSADTGWAAPSPATDGKRVLAMFAGGLLICLGADGALLWSRDFGTPDNPYGIASSPVLYRDEVIVQWDQSNMTLIAALAASDGRILWRRSREGGPSWATPIVAEREGKTVLLVVGNPSVEALDPDTGRLLWEQPCMMGDAAPSPAFSGGTVFTASNIASVTAIEVWKGAEAGLQENAGDAPKPGDVLWTYEDDLPDTPSLLASERRLYAVTGSGTVSAVALENGRLAWKQRLGVPVSSSPILIGDVVFLADKEGILHRFKDGPRYRPLPDTAIGAPVWATPALLDGRLYVRTDAGVVCLGGAR